MEAALGGGCSLGYVERSQLAIALFSSDQANRKVKLEYLSFLMGNLFKKVTDLKLLGFIVATIGFPFIERIKKKKARCSE